jgi:hypothetical protein
MAKEVMEDLARACMLSTTPTECLLSRRLISILHLLLMLEVSVLPQCTVGRADWVADSVITAVQYQAPRRTSTMLQLDPVDSVVFQKCSADLRAVMEDKTRTVSSRLASRLPMKTL